MKIEDISRQELEVYTSGLEEEISERIIKAAKTKISTDELIKLQSFYIDKCHRDIKFFIYAFGISFLFNIIPIAMDVYAAFKVLD